MTENSKLNNFHSLLNGFTGTGEYFHNPLYKNLYYTEGVRYFLQNAGEGAYWFLTLVATEIKPILKEDFYFIYLRVNDDETAKITVQRDKDEPVLYEKELNYTDCPYSEESYKFCFDCYSEQAILCLLSEY